MCKVFVHLLLQRLADSVLSFLKKIDEKKATGLDRIPSKLLKMAASIIAPSLTFIFSKSILTGIYPNDWKAAKVTPLLNQTLLWAAHGWMLPCAFVSKRVFVETYDMEMSWIWSNVIHRFWCPNMVGYWHPFTCVAKFLL